jgi:hypothetical protein
MNTRTSITSIKREAQEAYSDGREMGFSHREAVERAVSLTGNATCAVEEWVETWRCQFDEETV